MMCILEDRYSNVYVNASEYNENNWILNYTQNNFTFN